MPDDWGGNTMVIPVSAKQKQGIEDLLEAILLVADNTDIRANPKGEVIGTIIEAELDKSKGPVATLLGPEWDSQHGRYRCGWEHLWSPACLVRLPRSQGPESRTLRPGFCNGIKLPAFSR